MEVFTKEYAVSYKQLGEKRAARKEQRAAEVCSEKPLGEVSGN